MDPEKQDERGPTPDTQQVGSVSEERGIVTKQVVIPDGGLQAWLSVLGGFLVLTSTFGYSNSFGVYQELYVLEGASTSSNISWIGSVQLFFMFAMGLPAGKLVDEGYFHHLLAIGSIIYVFCMFMLSLASPHKFYQLILSQGVGMGIGAGLMLVPAVSIQAHHWQKRRSLAMGIVMTGSGVGGLFYPIMLNHLIQGHVGYKWGVRDSAFLTLGLLAIANCCMTTRLPNAKQRPPGPKPDIKGIMSDPAFLILLAGGFCVLWGLFFAYYYLQLFALLHGIDSNLAFYTIAILNGVSIFGRTLPNVLADKIGPLNVFIPVNCITGALVFAMFGATSRGAVVVFSILYGFFSGASIALLPPTVASVANNVQEIGVRMGLGYFVVSWAMLTGPPIDGALYDAGDVWYKPIIFSGVVILIGTVFITIARHIYSGRKGTQRL
ncbi:MFS general substrate transporter [Wolfiporia cocos MD-104 SS10]|uniref:MFS general substrate transporter n=1 Tax=Wolfiporia cocos (strain MD-104) TaxID=742152 RepID=A0A2H3IUR9_WOLCO|nr:MFS general substrate transporter [Wolfiporia cocos MD-104 SS10]